MSAPAASGPSLARVTVAAPTRRLDLALPDNMLVAELLPHLLRHAEGALGEPAGQHDGWVLRRATGSTLDPGRNLAAQGVRDGELLHLDPAREDWPEPAYDDVVEVIASSSRRAGRSWNSAATRRCGLAVTTGALLLGLTGLAATGPGRVLPGVIALIVAMACTALGVLLSRAFEDAGAGGIVAAGGLPYAFFGGAWLLAGPGGVLSIGAPGLALGSSALLVASLLGYAGVTGLTRLFVAGLTAALTGLLAATLVFAGVTAEGAAAVTLTLAIGLLPAYPVLAGWIGRLPFPDLPNQAEEIRTDHRLPRRVDVFAAVVRASEVLSGFLLSAALCSVVVTTWLALSGPGVAAVLLMAAAIAALLLRARLLPTPQQRVPLLTAGLLGLAGLGAGPVVTGAAPGVVLVVLAAGVVVVALPSALIYSRKTPSPYLGRAGDILDIVAIMALIPLACAVAGVFDGVRDLFASIGG